MRSPKLQVEDTPRNTPKEKTIAGTLKIEIILGTCARTVRRFRCPTWRLARRASSSIGTCISSFKG